MESIVLGVLLAVLIVRLLAFIDVAQTELDTDVADTAGTVLESAREAAQAANQAAAPARSEAPQASWSYFVVLPAIRVTAAASGASRFARALGAAGNRPLGGPWRKAK